MLDANDEETRAYLRRYFRLKDRDPDEEFLLQVIAEQKNKYRVYWALLALRDCGTDKSLPVLKTLFFYPMQDVKCVAILTIAHIAGSRETPLNPRLSL
jgi:hypothetical protein